MRFLPVAFVLAILCAACGGDAKEIPTAPTVSPASVSESFSGSLTVQNQNSHNFFVSSAGQLAITLTAVGPPSDIAIGLGLGVPSGFSCALTLGTGTFNTVQASTAPQIKGIAIPGTFCVTVYDVGNVMDTVDYTITVDHS
jgi:hypothetical protein